ncbi:class I SAM-dependent methyltransferase [Nocardia sp. NPDC058058]|uniref:class I SAM-dependent methyltransferase n=1 Tax=Nocardia sp. NPDC058058 TaxID=3346317 RepID=UPI0036DA8421
MSTADPVPRPATHRRLLAAARCRFAEDRLADAVTAGIDQVILLGPALDTFARHNPYPGLRVFEVRPDLATGTTAFVPPGALVPPDLEFGFPAADFDRLAPVFIVGLGTRSRSGEFAPCDIAALDRTVAGLGNVATGSEVILDYLPGGYRAVSRLLCDTGFEVLEDLGAAALACRYLDRPIEPGHSGEPRVIRARVRNNSGRPLSSLVIA